MTEVTKEQVLETLKTVRGPDLEHNIVELGMVSDVFISDAKVYFSITVPAELAQELEPLRLAAERVIKEMPGVKGALVALTADKKIGAAPAAPPPQGHGHAHPIPRAIRRAPARSAFPASSRSSRLPPARVASASRPPPSTWRLGSSPTAFGSAFSMLTSTALRCRGC